jgi:hypothetical protein
MGAISDRDPAPRRDNPGDGQDSSCASAPSFTPAPHVTSRHRLCTRSLPVRRPQADAILELWTMAHRPARIGRRDAYVAEAYSKQTGRQPDHTLSELSSECASVSIRDPSFCLRRALSPTILAQLLNLASHPVVITFIDAAPAGVPHVTTTEPAGCG